MSASLAVRNCAAYGKRATQQATGLFDIAFSNGITNARTRHRRSIDNYFAGSIHFIAVFFAKLPQEFRITYPVAPEAVIETDREEFRRHAFHKY